MMVHFVVIHCVNDFGLFGVDGFMESLNMIPLMVLKLKETKVGEKGIDEMEIGEGGGLMLQ